MMLLVKDTPRKKVPVKTESKSFIQTMRLLFGALTKSKSLIFTIIAILGLYTWLKELHKKKLTANEL